MAACCPPPRTLSRKRTVAYSPPSRVPAAAFGLTVLTDRQRGIGPNPPLALPSLSPAPCF